MRTAPPSVALGIAILALSIGMFFLVRAHPEQLRAPAWVVYTAVGAFSLAGLCVIAQARGKSGWARWLVCILLAAMTAIPAWIALGGGTRECAVAVFGASAAASENLCRGAFGGGAVTTAILLVVAGRHALRPRRGKSGSD